MFVNQLVCLIRHRKLTVILVTIGESESDNVVSRLGDVELEAVGRLHGRVAENHRSWDLVQLHRHITDVLREGHREVMAIDGGLDGVAFGDALNRPSFDTNRARLFYNLSSVISTAPCW